MRPKPNRVPLPRSAQRERRKGAVPVPVRAHSRERSRSLRGCRRRLFPSARVRLCGWGEKAGTTVGGSSKMLYFRCLRSDSELPNEERLGSFRTSQIKCSLGCTIILLNLWRRLHAESFLRKGVSSRDSRIFVKSFVAAASMLCVALFYAWKRDEKTSLQLFCGRKNTLLDSSFISTRLSDEPSPAS